MALATSSLPVPLSPSINTVARDGATCSIASDCTSLVCSGGVCAVPTCTDVTMNGKETDVDCGGGTCAKCIDTNDPKWKEFIGKVVGLIEKDGNAKITIDACASHVPTRTFGTNEKLSNTRMEAARKSLLDAIKAAGKNTDALLLESVNHLVQGPKYEGDWKNTDKYSKFQFVKLKVK